MSPGCPAGVGRTAAILVWLLLAAAPLHAQHRPPPHPLRSLAEAPPLVPAPPAESARQPATGLLPPGLLRYAVPADARPLAAAYVLGGAALIPLDEPLFRALHLDAAAVARHGAAGRASRRALRAVSVLGDPPVVALGLLGLYGLGGERERDAARVTGVAYGNAIVLTYAVKALLGKERPADAQGRPRYRGPVFENAAFPSAHASGSAAAAHVMAQYYPAAAPAFYGSSGLIGVSRVALGRHWPSDVWWGWGVGWMAAEGALGERERIESWSPW